jgi:hypothetical protein
MSDKMDGFTRDEYFRAFSMILPAAEAAREADAMMEGPEGAMISEGLADILSLVSDDCARRVQVMSGMTAEEARVRRAAQSRLLTSTDRLQDLFTQGEIEKALAFVMPPQEAKHVAQRVFEGAEDPVMLDIPVQLFELVILVSDDCAKRVQTLFGWSDTQLAVRRTGIELVLKNHGS